MNSAEVPRLLIEAVNAASSATRTSWLGFLAFTAYLFIAIAGVNHTDLLLNSPVALPILQVDISLDQFFLFAPLVYVFFHFGVLVQHVALAQKIELLNSYFEESETTSGNEHHPGRFELHPYFITQAVAGPSRGCLIAVLLDYTTWLSLAVIPVVLLLYFQTAFLPYHDVASTWAHRGYLLLDLAIISLIGVYFSAPLRRFWSAAFYSIWQYPARVLISGLVTLSAVLFSFLIATIPDSDLDRFAASLPGWSQAIPGEGRTAFAPTALLFEGEVDRVSGRNRSWFSRNLIVTDADLVAEDKGLDGEVSLNLRGRDLRYATLDRSDLHGADLTGATLRSASLSGTRLENALLVGADLRDAKFWRVGQEDADFTPARLSRASFRRARMEGANLHASVGYGADFSKAELTGAVLLAAQLQGADFQHANLTAANLTGANLEAARFTGAKLFGANLSQARAVGADFQGAWLIGTDMRAANVNGADLRQGQIWLSVPPTTTATPAPDLRFRMLVAAGDSIKTAITSTIEKLDNKDLTQKLMPRVAPILDATASAQWPKTREYENWQQALSQAQWGENEKARITRFLSALACSDLTPGAAIANGVARRASATFLFQPSFNGDVAMLFRTLTGNDCNGASNKLRSQVLQDLSRAAQLSSAATPGLPTSEP